MQETVQSGKKVLRGVVVSCKMSKTIVVAHSRTYRNLHTDKIMKKQKKYKVHDENSIAKQGDVVEFYEGRPVSKTKYMYLARVVEQ